MLINPIFGLLYQAQDGNDKIPNVMNSDRLKRLKDFLAHTNTSI